MRLDFSLDGSESSAELNAVALLIASLGGRVGPLLDSLQAELHHGAPQAVPLATVAPEPAPLAAPPPPNSENGPSTAPAAPTPPAPSPSAAPPPPTNGAVELDSAGLPWDERIHSSSKNKNAGDGKWKYMRGLDKTIVPAIEAELRARMGTAAPTPPLAPPAASPPAAPPPPTDTAPAAPVAAPPASVAPAATVAANSGLFPDMAAFVTFVSSKGLPYADLTAAALAFGKTSFQEITKDSATWDGFVESFGWNPAA